MILFIFITAVYAQDVVASTFDFRFTQLDTPIVIPDSGGYIRVGLRIMPLFIGGDNYISLVSEVVIDRDTTTTRKVCVIEELSLVPNEPIDISYIQYVPAGADSGKHIYVCSLKSSTEDTTNYIFFKFIKTGKHITDSANLKKLETWSYLVIEEGNDDNAILPDLIEYTLLNPMAPSTDIHIEAQVESRIMQSLYNSDYELLSVQNSGLFKPGRITINLSSTFQHQSSGIYYLKLTNDFGVNSCRKMILVK